MPKISAGKGSKSGRIFSEYIAKWILTKKMLRCFPILFTRNYAEVKYVNYCSAHKYGC